MNYSYGGDRLHNLAKNILIGMELVDKRVDNRPKDIKTDLNEEEQLKAIKETNDFFADKRMQRKLEALKSLIVDNTYRNQFQQLYGNSLQTTPQSVINEMNMKVSYNPYSEK